MRRNMSGAAFTRTEWKTSGAFSYVSVDEPHLGRYVDEEVFRFNERKLNDGQRFTTVLPGVVGKRLTYKALIGNTSLEGLAISVEAESDGLCN